MKTCVIYDKKGDYGKRLFSGFLQKEDTSFNVMLFTGIEELKRYVKENVPDVILVCEEYIDEIIAFFKGNIIILTDEAYVNEEYLYGDSKYSSIYRFQPLERIYKDVIIKAGLKRNTKLKTLELIGIYTPDIVEPKVSFSLSVARVMSEKYKTLYLSLDEFSGLDELLAPNNNYTLSDAIYFYKQSKTLAYDNIVQTIGNVSGIDYIAPVVCSDDISDITPKELQEFIEQIGEMFGYEVIVVDIGNGVRMPWKLMECCNVVYIPEKSDYISQRRMSAFENYYISMGMEQLIDRFEKIRLPEGENDMKSDYWEKASYNGMYRYVKNLLLERGCSKRETI